MLYYLWIKPTHTCLKLLKIKHFMKEPIIMQKRMQIVVNKSLKKLFHLFSSCVLFNIY